MKIAVIVKKNGILYLEDFLFKQCLTKSGEFLFNRKIDKFLYWIMRFIVDDGYTSKTNQYLLKTFSKMSSRRTRLALNVASLCIDGMMNQNNLDLIYIEVCSYVGVTMHKKLWDIKFKQEHELSSDENILILTEEQKKRIEEVNVFFKIKEEECKIEFQKKLKEFSEYQGKLPDFKKHLLLVDLIYKSGNGQGHLYGFGKSESESEEPIKGPHFIGEIAVCSSMSAFWHFRDDCGCGRNIEKFMYITDDLPNRLEKNLHKEITMELKLEEYK